MTNINYTGSLLFLIMCLLTPALVFSCPTYEIKTFEKGTISYPASDEDKKAMAEAVDAAINKVRRDLDKFVTDNQLLNMGFYITNGKVFINTNEYFFSCSRGNFHPGQLPESFIANKSFLDKLHSETTGCN